LETWGCALPNPVYVSLDTAKKDLIFGNSLLSVDCKVLLDVLRFADKKLRVYLATLEHRSDERIPFL
jgi:hypothetical protein